MRALASIQRFDVKRLGSKEKTLLVSVLFQYSGMIITRASHLDCDFPHNAMKILQQTLDSSMQYFVETEPMQLARNIIDNIARNTTNATAMSSTKQGRGEAKPLRRAQSHFDTTTLSSDVKSMSQYSLEKAPNLRPVEAPSRRSFLGRRKSTQQETNSFLTYTSNEPIQKSLMTLQKSEEEVACELFKVLLVVMSDRPLQSLNNSRIMKTMAGGAGDEYGLANELVSIGMRTVALRDELYLQLLKQLNRNTKFASRLRGWSLLILYLHSFPPSQPFIPYLRAFIAQQQTQDLLTNTGVSLSAGGTITAGLSTTRRARDLSLLSKSTDIEEIQGSTISTVVSYAKKVLVWTEYETLSSDGFHSDISMIDAALVADIIKRTPMQVEVSVLTGSVYQFTISFGEIDSLFSLLGLLLLKLVGPRYSSATLLKSGMDGGTSSSTEKPTAVTQTDLLTRLFRGFWFYSSDSIDNSHDTQALPVQPDEPSVMQWSHDFIWDMLQNNSDRRLRRLVLRRRLLLTSEELVNQLDLFKDMSAERDVIGTQRLWSLWLHEKATNSSGGHHDLPIDHTRIDLLFAEETRYVNSQLYAMSLEALIYLTALQLALSFGDFISSDAPGLWGGEHSDLMSNSDGSIRPCLSAKSYAPMQSPRGGGRSSILSTSEATTAAVSSPNLPLERRGSLERRASGLGNLFKGRTSVQSEVTDGGDGGREGDNEGGAENVWCGEIISPNATRDLELLEDRLLCLGVSLPPDATEEIMNSIASFQTMAKHLNTSLSAPRFRYLMKSAYVSYVMAWPLAGGHFFEGYLDRRTGGGEGAELEKILICISGNGLHLLTIEDWLLIFQAPIYDIQSCTISSSAAYASISTESKLLSITVNERTLPIVTTSGVDIQTLIEAFSLEMLSRGSFPHGLEGGNDILDLGESYLLASDSKAVMQRFLRNYPMLPTPPPPCALERAPTYFDPPKSRRAILAEERAEEERIELEQARLAAESHAAKNLAHLEHGKQTLQKFMTEDDDDDDEEGGADGGGEGGKKVKKSKRRSATTMTETAENIRNHMITAAVSGVSQRPPLITLSIPPPPVRGVGMRLDSMFGGDTTNKPAKIRSNASSRQLQAPTVAPAAYKPKFVIPKNVSFPLPVVWSRHLTLKELQTEFHRLQEEGGGDGEEEEREGSEEGGVLFQQSDFYGSSYHCRPESIMLPAHWSANFTRPRQASTSVVLYASPSVPGVEDERALSPTSGGESDNERFTPLPQGAAGDYEVDDEEGEEKEMNGE
jgi:hypothetical protein